MCNFFSYIWVQLKKLHPFFMNNIFLINILKEGRIILQSSVSHLSQASDLIAHYLDGPADNWTCKAYTYSLDADAWIFNEELDKSSNQVLVDYFSSKGYHFNAV